MADAVDALVAAVTGADNGRWCVGGCQLRRSDVPAATFCAVHAATRTTEVSFMGMSRISRIERLARSAGYGVGEATSATATLLAADAAITYSAQAWRGEQANAIRVRYVVNGNNTPLSVAVSGTPGHEAPNGLDVTVNVATDGGGAATSSAAAVVAAVNSSAARNLVLATGSGTGGAEVVSAVAYTALTGGV